MIVQVSFIFLDVYGGEGEKNEVTGRD